MALPGVVGQIQGAAAAVAGALGLGPAAQKTWKDRQKQAAYTSPKGTRIKFDYEDVSRGFNIRGTMFEYPGVDGGYPQRSGFGARRYPLQCIFSGGTCDLQASAFEAALCEPGVGKLEHPLYGTFDVVPLGEVERNDALKTAANQSVVTVTFWTTIGAIYPSSSSNAKNEIDAAIANFNVQAAQQLASSTSLSSIGKALGAIGTFKKLLNTVKKDLNAASDAVASVRKDFAAGVAAINDGMDVLIGDPLQLALQVSNLIQAPGRALAGLASRLDGYAALANSIFGSSTGNPAGALTAGSVLADRQAKVANDFHISSLFALSAVSGTVVTVAAQPISGLTQALSLGGTTFSTRGQVVAAAAALLDQHDALTAWRDAGYAALAGVSMPANLQIDTGEAAAALQSCVALAAGYLLQASFSLLPEKAIVVDRKRTIIDLCSEIYPGVSVDGKLDLLISTNNLTGDEIIELPAGRRIVYYPS